MTRLVDSVASLPDDRIDLPAEVLPDVRPPREWGPDSAAEPRTRLLHDLPDRLRHSLLCGRHAGLLAAAVPPEDRDLLVAAAYLHDVGYSALVRSSGFHPLDGARYLRLLGAPPRLAALVAHHSEARLVARACNLMPALAEFRRERTLVSDALTYADMTAGPTGIRMSPQDRFADIALRHLNQGPRVRSARSSRVPLLLAAVDRVNREILGSNPLVIAERETVMSSTLASRNADAQSAGPPRPAGLRDPHQSGGDGGRAGGARQSSGNASARRPRGGSRRPGPARPGGLLEEQSAERVPELVPIRYGRMAVSPFTFYRGAARVMAADLAATPHSGADRPALR